MNFKNPEERQLKKDLLKEGYSKGKRTMEILSTFAFFVLIVAATCNLVANFSPRNLLAFLGGAIGAMLFADFLSGMVHWLADTWGTLETPIGGSFIRSFREHHIDPAAMTRHDIFETNGDNVLVTLIPLYIMARREISVRPETGLPDSWEYCQFCFWFFTSLFVALTNQIHKWAHTYKPPALVVLLQDCGLILSRGDHSAHHRAPFDRSYCITNGWLNRPLQAIGFWTCLEVIITRITGYRPREDDHRWTGLIPTKPEFLQRALALSKQQEPQKPQQKPELFKKKQRRKKKDTTE